MTNRIPGNVGTRNLAFLRTSARALCNNGIESHQANVSEVSHFQASGSVALLVLSTALATVVVRGRAITDEGEEVHLLVS